MKILFLAPQPVYQDRGSPIAIRMVLEVMSERGDVVDLVTYHEGVDLDLKNVTFHRIPNLSFVRNVRPGFSFKKLICDFFMIFKIAPLVIRNRYDVVHGVEEAVFFALLLKVLFRLPYVYDMDSSLAQQMVEKNPKLAFLSSVLNFFEGLAVRHAEVVVPVCDALADTARAHRPRKLTLLYDVPLLQEAESAPPEPLRDQLGIRGVMAMYVGNLESYQGIDLLLEAFATAAQQVEALDLVIIGGAAADIDTYKQKSRTLGLEQRVHLLGPRPINQLGAYLAQADILVSPRTKGNNTPMKIYSYMDSGRAILATDLRTHTQVLDAESALLVPPQPAAYAEGMIRLAQDAALRQQLGQQARRLIEEKYNYTVFRRTLTQMLDELEGQDSTPAPRPAEPESVS